MEIKTASTKLEVTAEFTVSRDNLATLSSIHVTKAHYSRKIQVSLKIPFPPLQLYMKQLDFYSFCP